MTIFLAILIPDLIIQTLRYNTLFLFSLRSFQSHLSDSQNAQVNKVSDWHPLRYKKVEKAVKLWQNRSIHVKRMILLFETGEVFFFQKK